MAGMTLAGHAGTSLSIDSCTNCQAFWFDTHESLQLSPGSTLKLFKLIGEHSSSGKSAFSGVLRCPRCAARLLLTHDFQRNTPFSYWRCDSNHGRFITFFDFLREKNFIRPLSPQQLEELRQNIQIVNCSNCGAPVDLATSSACTHCSSPISMLDMKQAE
jgi:DNA-directed RNA polymerase subunit RPC12/RpoP